MTSAMTNRSPLPRTTTSGVMMTSAMTNRSPLPRTTTSEVTTTLGRTNRSPLPRMTISGATTTSAMTNRSPLPRTTISGVMMTSAMTKRSPPPAMMTLVATTISGRSPAQSRTPNPRGQTSPYSSRHLSPTGSVLVAGFTTPTPLKYKSRGHADPVLRGWFELAISAANSDDELVRADGRRLLHSTLGLRDGVLSEASGKCLKCHSVDVEPRPGGGERFRINWYAGTASEAYPLTTFNHAKHIQTLSCTQCHQLDSDGGYASQFPGRGSWAERGRSPGTPQFDGVRSNFKPMDRIANCATCHQPAAAGNHCLQCHQYHARSHGIPAPPR